jgi:hypothetical protein
MMRRSEAVIRFAALSVFFVFALFFLMSLPGFAQEPNDTPDAVPPPLKVFPKEEKNRLEAETDPKKHMGLALQLTEAHLSRAEVLNSKSEFDLMYTELGAFNAVIDEALEFLARNDDGQGRILSSSKKLELGLRAYALRLETVRRDLPSIYEPYVKNLIKTVRNARSKAVEPFFGTSVVPQKNN